MIIFDFFLFTLAFFGCVLIFIGTKTCRNYTKLQTDLHEIDAILDRIKLREQKLQILLYSLEARAEKVLNQGKKSSD